MALKYAMLSLFSLHNETFNTWSHLAGGVSQGPCRHFQSLVMRAYYHGT